jgi:hypothetical protein
MAGFGNIGRFKNHPVILQDGFYFSFCIIRESVGLNYSFNPVLRDFQSDKTGIYVILYAFA